MNRIEVLEVFKNTCQVRLSELMIIVNNLKKPPDSHEKAIEQVKTVMASLVKATSGRKAIKAKYQTMTLVAFKKEDYPNKTIFAEISPVGKKRATEIILEGKGYLMWWYDHKGGKL